MSNSVNAVKQAILFWIKPVRERKVWIEYIVESSERLDNFSADDLVEELMTKQLYADYPYNDNYQVHSVKETDGKLGWRHVSAPRLKPTKSANKTTKKQQLKVEAKVVEPTKINRNFTDSGLIDREGNVYYCGFAEHHKLVVELSEKGIIHSNWSTDEQEQELWREKYKYRIAEEYSSWIEDNGWVKFSMGGFHFGNSHRRGIDDYHTYNYSLTQKQVDRIIDLLTKAGDRYLTVNSGDWITVEQFLQKIDPNMYTVINRPGSNMDKNSVGNKAYNLGRLKDFYVNVPGFIVIPSETCQRILKEGVVNNALLGKMDLPDGNLFSVRSSAPVSMPGMLDTFLNVPKHQIAEKMLDVVLSWNNSRAIEYRNLMNIPHDCKVSVIVQKMVDGEKDSLSGSGVLVVNGEKIYGEFVEKMLGEKLVGGSVTPKKLTDINEKILDQLKEVASEIRKLTSVPQEIEFTYESGDVFVLQTRDFKVKTLVTQTEITGVQIGLGRKGNQGVAKGKIVFDLEDIEKTSGDKIYVAYHTFAEDVPLMAKCNGVLTAIGGALSHAAIAAKHLDLPCVTGAGFKLENKKIFFGDLILTTGDEICVDGNTGKIFKNE